MSLNTRILELLQWFREHPDESQSINQLCERFGVSYAQMDRDLSRDEVRAEVEESPARGSYNARLFQLRMDGQPHPSIVALGRHAALRDLPMPELSDTSDITTTGAHPRILDIHNPTWPQIGEVLQVTNLSLRADGVHLVLTDLDGEQEYHLRFPGVLTGHDRQDREGANGGH